MIKYVIDTSVASRLYIKNQPNNKEAKNILRAAEEPDFLLFAPSLMWYELNNTFVKVGLSFNEISERLEDLQNLVDNEVLERIDCSPEILKKAAEIALSDKTGEKGYISSYDATFHALALSLGAIYITADKKHYNKTKDTIGSINLLENFILPNV